MRKWFEDFWVGYSKVAIFAMGLMVVSSCVPNDVSFFNGFGKRPIYVQEDELNDIKNEASHPRLTSGPIFSKDSLLFITEVYRGIHVYNVKDSLNIRYLTFFKIPAITDFTISGDRLYADSWTDLVTIDISDIYSISTVNRENDAFEPILAPPLYNGWFECVDLDKGAVVEWEEAQLTDAKCRTL